MKIFVTGVTGLLGSILAKTLIKKNYQVTGLLLPQEEIPDITNLKIARGDITSSIGLKEQMANHDAVVHVADISDAIICCLEQEKSIGEIYNVVTKNLPPWRQILFEISEMLNLKTKPKRVPFMVAYVAAFFMEVVSFITRKPPRLTRFALTAISHQYIYNGDKIERELGFSTKRNFLVEIKKLL